MTTIRYNIDIEASAAKVWEAIRDVGAVHTRFAAGFVVDTQLQPGARTVTFANGFVARERIISIDEALRRLAYSASSERIEYHHASFEVVPLSGTRTRLIWTADVMPTAAAEHVRAMMEHGSLAIADTLAKLS
ncbi:MAG TPA: SRPBCC family protein [Steroidobacteraceae bacterium]|nr:SRPBCC family protein [Steroidobacteraceae bacterium]